MEDPMEVDHEGISIEVGARVLVFGKHVGVRPALDGGSG
jgi:hypothetical protein